MTFEQAVEFILEKEGGYVFDSHDPGGETRYGISKRSYPNVDIKGLTRVGAIEIYLKDFWQPLRPMLLPASIRLALFDCAVNQGVERAIKFMQGAAGVAQDGEIGPKTLIAVNGNPKQVLKAFLKLRLNHYASLPTWDRYSKGWTARLLDIALQNVKET